ncbi:MAG: tetratricopeptide repeat protein, partial [Promethearchaeota archaeon]
MDKFKKSLKKAKKLLKKCQYDKAIKQFNICLSYNQKNANVWNDLAYIYNLKGEYKEAIAVAKRALEIDNNLRNALDNLFFSYDQEGKFNEVLEVLKRYLEIQPNLNSLTDEKLQLIKQEKFEKKKRSNIIPFKGGSIIKFKENDLIDLNLDAEPKEIFKALFEQFIQWYIKNVLIVNNKERTSKINLNNNIEYNICTSLKYTNIGKSNKKIEALKLITQYIPMSISTWDNLASSYKDTREYRKAIECYKKALDLDPKNINIMGHLGFLY